MSVVIQVLMSTDSIYILIPVWLVFVFPRIVVCVEIAQSTMSLFLLNFHVNFLQWWPQPQSQSKLHSNRNRNHNHNDNQYNNYDETISSTIVVIHSCIMYVCFVLFCLFLCCNNYDETISSTIVVIHSCIMYVCFVLFCLFLCCAQCPIHVVFIRS